MMLQICRSIPRVRRLTYNSDAYKYASPVKHFSSCTPYQNQNQLSHPSLRIASSRRIASHDASQLRSISTSSSSLQQQPGNQVNPSNSSASTPTPTTKPTKLTSRPNLKPAPIRPSSSTGSSTSPSSSPIQSKSTSELKPKTEPFSDSLLKQQSKSTATNPSTPPSNPSPSASSARSEPQTSPTKPEERETSITSKLQSFIHTLRLLFRFYFRGVKQIWWDSREISAIRKRLREEKKELEVVATSVEPKKVQHARDVKDQEIDQVKVEAKGIRWGEAAMIRSHHHDLLCLPLFLILLLLLEEAIPLIVIFAPALLPTTCLLESQREGIRRKEEIRRSLAWERLSGLKVEEGKGKGKGKRTSWELKGLGREELRDFSSIFSLPSYGPTFLLRHRLSNRLQFLQKDDQLLLKASKEPASSSYGMPTDREILAQAAGERGLRASGRSGTELRESLFNYLSLMSRGENQNKTTEELSIPIELYESKGLLEIRKQAQKESEKGVFAQAKDVMDSVLKEEREREVREKEKKEMEEKKKEKK